MASQRAWRTALVEHDAVLLDARAAIECVPVDRWHEPRAPEKWSPLEEAEHLRLSYLFGSDAVESGGAMSLAVNPVAAWVAGHVILPFVLRAQRFPRGAISPREVRPSIIEPALFDPREMSARLAVAAGRAVEALLLAERERPWIRVVHAYFGALPPCTALRLLSAHTQHHTAVLRRATTRG